MRIAWSFSGLHDFWKRSHPVVELAALKAFKATVECQASGKRSNDLESLENTAFNMSYMNTALLWQLSSVEIAWRIKIAKVGG